MISTTTERPSSLTASGEALDTSPDCFGELLDSSDAIFDAALANERMARDGYLYLPGLLNRDDVLAARRAIAGKLQVSGHLLSATDPMDCLAVPDREPGFIPEVAMQTPELLSVIYGDAMMGFWDRFFGEPARHFDFTWFRAVTPGRATPPHTDAVYMNRGSQSLITCWTPIGDAPLPMGPLMVLEGSHKHDKLRANYSSKDVDAICTNLRPNLKTGRKNTLRSGHFGLLSPNAVKLREALGGRWLTANFRAGDVLAFSIFTVHCSLDNHTDRIRLSSDSRYQPASHAVDERWIRINGEIAAHGPNAKRKMIC